jgi:L,D-transpeptidase YcbB
MPFRNPKPDPSGVPRAILATCSWTGRKIGPRLHSAGLVALALFFGRHAQGRIEIPAHDERFRSELLELYALRGGAPIWLRGGTATPQARSVASALRMAADEGLRPEDYDGLQWSARFDEEAAAFGEGSVLALDVAFTGAVMKYASDLALGRVDPRPSGNDAVASRRPLALARIVADLTGSDHVDAVLAALEPPFPYYRRVLLALRTYRVLLGEDDPGSFPDQNATVDPGETWSGVPRLARLLRLLGDLPEEPPRTGRYEGTLLAAVERFQRRHGLEPDGRIGRSTLRALRTPLEQRVAQLELTLERMRWLPRTLDGPPLVVNVPAFRLVAGGAGGQPPLDMKVVVGRAFRHETPLFVSEVRRVTFRPYWYVPKTILTNEVLPELRDHPGLFQARGYEVVDRQGRVVGLHAPGVEAQAKLRAGKLLLRQRPGSANPLGPVKFVLPNQYEVYLHGTAATGLFSRTRRDFSHGCIRVEDPVALAAWVLRDNAGWTRERAREAMGADLTISVDVAARIPVLVVYSTAAVNSVGEVLFFEDIYGHDEELSRALAPRARQTG